MSSEIRSGQYLMDPNDPLARAGVEPQPPPMRGYRTRYQMHYKEEFAQYVLRELRKGRTLLEICDVLECQPHDRPPGLPASYIVRAWMQSTRIELDGEPLVSLYNQARMDQADALFDSLKMITDAPLIGQIVETTTKGEELESYTVTPEHVGRLLRIKFRDGSVEDAMVTEDMIGDEITVQVTPPMITRKVKQADNIERSKLMYAARSLMVEKINPLKYGPRVAHQMLDQDGNPARSGITVIIDGAPGLQPPSHMPVIEVRAVEEPEPDHG